MSKVIFIIVCLLLTNVLVVSQTKKSPRKNTSSSKSTSIKQAPVQKIAAIPQSEWSEMFKFIESEDWEKVSAMAGLNLQRLAADNDRRQLSQLNYIYLYSSIGKVSQEKLTVNELKNIAQAMIGKEFIMFDRNVLDNCANSLNYVCPDKANKFLVRTTATNKDFTLIHSFEYVKLLQEFDFTKNNLKNAFVSGKLTKFEVNEKTDKAWVMRLFFEDGWIQVIEK